MPSRNWNTDDIQQPASPELTEIINSATDSTDLREKLRAYYEKEGLATYDETHNGLIFGKVDPKGVTLSRIVTVNGKRQMITGARSEAELDAFEAALRAER